MEPDEYIDQQLATVIIELDKTKMSASLTFRADGPNPVPPTEREIVSAIKLSGIRCGISRKTLVEMLRSPRYDEPVVFARGREPENGRDAVIDYKVSTSRKEAVPKSLESGQVDFRNLDLIETVAEGALLAVKIPATEGVPGYNLLGETLKARPGKERLLKMGRNVVISEDGMQAFAAIDGAVTFNGDRVEVTPVIEIRGDVDYSVGNLDFSGSIIVHGAVLSGFVVRGGGDVIINGTVEAATVEAGGTLTIKGGVVGQDRAVLTAKGDVVARFLNETTVRAGGNVLTDGAILHCRVEAGGSVLASGKTGLISGGEIQARDGVLADVLGTSMGTRTEIVVGYDPELPAQAAEMENAIRERRERLETIQERLNGIQKVDPSKLPKETQEALKKSLETAEHLSSEIAGMEERLVAMRESIERSRAATIKVANEIYPGVSVNIAGAQLRVPNAMKALTFARERGEIVTRSTF